MEAAAGGNIESAESADGFATTWSALSPGDLGLKAGVCNKAGELTFCPILGWVTVTKRKIGTEEAISQLHPVLLNEVGYPTLAMFVRGCVGVFPKDMSDEQAVEFSKRWRDANKKRVSPTINKSLN